MVPRTREGVSHYKYLYFHHLTTLPKLSSAHETKLISILIAQPTLSLIVSPFAPALSSAICPTPPTPPTLGYESMVKVTGETAQQIFRDQAKCLTRKFIHFKTLLPSCLCKIECSLFFCLFVVFFFISNVQSLRAV